MKLLIALLKAVLPFLMGFNTLLFAANFVPANHPHIPYLGRWDKTDPLQPKHSWPGVSIYAEFSGTSVGVRMADHDHYFNVYIDGKFCSVFHGSQSAEADYILAEGLEEGKHTFLLTKRNCAQNRAYALSGLLLDDGGKLLAPPRRDERRRIEFIGDS